MPIIPSIAALDAFIKRLEQHDWYYSFSDDNRVWRSGSEVAKQLAEDAKANNYFDTAHKAYCEYISENIRGTHPEAILRIRRDTVIKALKDGVRYHELSSAIDYDDTIARQEPSKPVAMSFKRDGKTLFRTF